MKLQRTIPPAAATLRLTHLMHGCLGLLRGRLYLENVEKELRDYFGVRHLFLVSSGKAALTIILRALSSLYPKKREVLIPAYTCFSVPSAVVKAGLDVSLCDIETSTFDFNYELLSGAVHDNTLCIIPDHLFGMPSDMNRINTICREKGVFAVEDCAQVMGGLHGGKKLGAIGDVGFFSLGRGKHVTCGSGGIIITNSDRIAAALENEYATLERPRAAENLVELLKAMVLALFIRPSLYWLPAGLPFLKLGETIFHRDFPIKRLSGMKAALLTGWQDRLEKSNRIRKENGEYICGRLGLNISPEFSRPFLRLPILAANRKIRDGIYALSRERGRGISCMYPASVNRIPEIEHLFVGKNYPAASDTAERILTLPTHELLSEKDKRDIIELIRGISFSAGEAVYRVQGQPIGTRMQPS